MIPFDVLEAPRLPELYRLICRYTGLPLPPAVAEDRFVVRSGDTPPELLAMVLEEAFVEDEAEVLICPSGEVLDVAHLPPGQLVVRPGFESPCPDGAALCGSVGGGPVMLFAVERRDAEGRLRGVTWAAVPEEEPPPTVPFRAAVARG